MLISGKETREFLEMMTLCEPRRYISSKIKREDFKKYWRKAKEKTSSSVSGIYFGYYKGETESEKLKILAYHFWI